MVKISANLGFLWAHLPLPQQIEHASAAGFTAVEFHFPYDHPANEIAELTKSLGLKVVGLNTALGPGGVEELGLAARPGRQREAEHVIDQAIAYAEIVDADYVSVVAGRISGAEAEQTFVENLSYACSRAAEAGINIVIEPLSLGAAPGYFLNTVEQAVSIIEQVDAPNMKLMLDCFHTQTDQGEVASLLAKYVEHLGHVQVASVPHRAEPDAAGPNYLQIFDLLDELGYEHYVGAEYHPKTTVEEGLGWLKELIS